MVPDAAAASVGFTFKQPFRRFHFSPKNRFTLKQPFRWFHFQTAVSLSRIVDISLVLSL